MTGSRCHSLDWQSDVVFLKSSFRVEIYGKDLVSGASQSLISEDCSQKKGIQICDSFSYRHAGKITRMPCNKGYIILHPKFYRASLRFKKAVNFKVCGKV